LNSLGALKLVDLASQASKLRSCLLSPRRRAYGLSSRLLEHVLAGRHGDTVSDQRSEREFCGKADNYSEPGYSLLWLCPPLEPRLRPFDSRVEARQ
jgi:hypothetical protein